MGLVDKKEFARQFERTLDVSKAKAYSNVSLERELTDKEFGDYKQVMEKFPNIKYASICCVA